MEQMKDFQPLNIPIPGALAAMLDLGKGRGPMSHAFCLTGEFSEE